MYSIHMLRHLSEVLEGPSTDLTRVILAGDCVHFSDVPPHFGYIAELPAAEWAPGIRI